ncbi:MAG: gliding motility-associated C-terminal domain-containing protein, partial [Bacteroidota bacterium]
VITFTNLSSGAVSYEWDFGDTTDEYTCYDTTYSYNYTGIYPVMLIAYSSFGCPDTAIKIVFIEQDYALFTPSAFTPNKDGINDYFLPQGIGIDGDGFEMYIYDRWGDLIYETEGIFGDYDPMAEIIGWDGCANDGQEKAQQDVYVWVVFTEDKNGDMHQYIGHVTLIR